MNETKIILTTTSIPPEAQCPLYHQLGDGFAINVPQVVSNSGKACIYVIKEVLGQVLEITCDHYQRTTPLASVYCPKGVKFALQLQQTNIEEASEYIECLSRVPIFSKLPPEALGEIGSRIEVVDYRIGEFIIQKGEPGRNFYIVHKGVVQVLQERKSGGTQILTTLSENECFGEMSLLTGELCSASIRAATPVILLAISKEKFNEILRLVVELNQHFTKVLADRLRKSNNLLEDALDQGVMGKLNMISLPELIQAVNVSGRNGVLTLNRQHEGGTIYCTQGKVVDCEIQGRLDLAPEESFFYLLTWENGDFRFEQEISHNREPRIFYDPMSLLMEGLRRLDESSKG